MPQTVSTKRPPRQPSYRLHKARKCAVVTLNGKNHYLGPYDSPESHEKYARLIAEWRVNGKEVAAIASPLPNGALAINDLVLRYLDFAEIRERFTKFDLVLHPEKTRVISFGRYERQNAERQKRRPNTFDFLGFTHYCDCSRRGKYKRTQQIVHHLGLHALDFQTI